MQSDSQIENDQPASLQPLVMRRYDNPRFLFDLLDKPNPVVAVEYRGDTAVVEVGRWCRNNDGWYREKFSFPASELPEANIAKRFNP